MATLSELTEQTVEVIAGTPGARGEEMNSQSEEVAEKQLLKVQEDGERLVYRCTSFRRRTGPARTHRPRKPEDRTGMRGGEPTERHSANEMVRVKKE